MNTPMVQHGAQPAPDSSANTGNGGQCGVDGIHKLVELLNRFRGRARCLAYFSYAAVLGAVVVLLCGLYFFYFQSSDLALRDLQQRRQASMPAGDAIDAVAKAYETIEEAAKEKERLETELPAAKTKLETSREWNDAYYDMYNIPSNDDYINGGDYAKLRLDWTRLRPVGGMTRAEMKRKTDEEWSTWNANRRLSRAFTWKRFTLPEIREIIDILKDDRPDREASLWIRDEYEEFVKDLTERGIPYWESELDSIQKQLSKAKEDNIGKGTLGEIEKRLNSTREKLESRRKTLEETKNLLLRQAEFAAIAKEKIGEARQAAERELPLAIEAIAKKQLDDEELGRQVNSLESSLETKRRQLANAQATKDLLAVANAKAEAGVHAEVTRNDLIFTITANLSRIGAVIVVVFFAQVFLSVYRFSMQLSGYYHARADALELVLNSSTPADKTLDALVLMIPVFSPDLLDFKRPSSPTEDLTKLAATLKELKS